MKKNRVFAICSILVSCLSVLTSCGPTQDSAARYDMRVNNEFESFSHVYTEYALSMNKRDSITHKPLVMNMEDYRVYACNQVLYSMDTINKIKGFGDDESYINALKNYITVMQKTMQEYDGPKIKLLMKDSAMTREDSAKVKELTQKTLMETDKAYLEFQRTQAKFREKNGLKPGGE